MLSTSKSGKTSSHFSDLVPERVYRSEVNNEEKVHETTVGMTFVLTKSESTLLQKHLK